VRPAAGRGLLTLPSVTEATSLDCGFFQAGLSYILNEPGGVVLCDSGVDYSDVETISKS
jgi:hypothetical protein